MMVLSWVLRSRSYAWVLLLCPLALVLAIPPFRTDDLIYHLLIPARIVAEGWFFDPHNINTNLPATFEMMLVPLVWLRAHPFVLNLAVLGALAVVIARVTTERTGSRTLGVAQAALVAYLPVSFEIVSSCYVELFFALVVVAAVVSLGRFQQERERTGTWWWTMALLGVACGTKYFGLIYLVYVAVVEFFAWRGPRWRLYAGVALALAIASPWYIKNAILLGNPFFPLLSSVFPSEYLSAARAFQFERLAWNYHDGRGVMDFLLLIPKLVVGYEPAPGIGRLGFDGAIGGVLILSLLGLRWRTVGERTVSGLFVAYFVFWAVTSQQVRFLLPVVILTAIQGMTTIAQWWRVRPVLVGAGLALLMVQDAVGIWRSVSADHIASLVTGQITREQFLEKHLPVSYGFAQVVNRTLDPAHHKVLTIGNYGRDYYFRVPTLTHTYYDTEFFDRACAVRNPTPASLDSTLHAERVTHILWNWQYYRFVHGTAGVVDIGAVERWFGERCTPVVAAGEVVLYAINPLGD